MAAGGTQLAGDGETIHVWKHDIKNCKVWFVCSPQLVPRDHWQRQQPRQRRAARSGEKFADIWFVVNYKKFCFSRFCTHELQFAQEVWELAERELILFF